MVETAIKMNIDNYNLYDSQAYNMKTNESLLKCGDIYMECNLNEFIIFCTLCDEQFNFIYELKKHLCDDHICFQKKRKDSTSYHTDKKVEISIDAIKVEKDDEDSDNLTELINCVRPENDNLLKDNSNNFCDFLHDARSTCSNDFESLHDFESKKETAHVTCTTNELSENNSNTICDSLLDTTSQHENCSNNFDSSHDLKSMLNEDNSPNFLNDYGSRQDLELKNMTYVNIVLSEHDSHDFSNHQKSLQDATSQEDSCSNDLYSLHDDSRDFLNNFDSQPYLDAQKEIPYATCKTNEYNGDLDSKTETQYKTYTSTAFKDDYSNKFCNKCQEYLIDHQEHVCPFRGITKDLFECEICAKTFSLSRYLKRHKKIHEDYKPYQCKTCEAKFADKSNFTVHVRRHTNDKPYQCSYCDTRYVTSTDRFLHERYHLQELKQFVCEICGIAKTSKTSLLSHRKHHLNIENHKCSYCEKSFVTKYSLRKHLAIHRSQQSYECEICDLSFKTVRAFNNHSKKTHEFVKCSCEVCGKKFEHFDALRKHICSFT